MVDKGKTAQKITDLFKKIPRIPSKSPTPSGSTSVLGKRPASTSRPQTALTTRTAQTGQSGSSQAEHPQATVNKIKRELDDLKANDDPDSTKYERLERLIERLAIRATDAYQQMPSLSLGQRSYPTDKLVPTSDHVAEVFQAAIKRLHNTHPNHPIFGDERPGSIQLPFKDWLDKAKLLGKSVEKVMGKKILRQSCWLVVDENMMRQKKIDSEKTRQRLKAMYTEANMTPIPAALDGKLGTMVRLWYVRTVRVLAFFDKPTSANFAALQRTGTGPAVPFQHACHMGRDGRQGLKASCVNGIEHGWFGTAASNNEQRQCAEAGRCLADDFDGHKGLDGQFGGKCIFVHTVDGWAKPCVNGGKSVEECCCIPPCF